MRLSLEGQRTVYAEETGDYPIILITLEHPDLAQPILISTDATTRIPSLTNDEQVVYGTVSNGKEYLFFPVEVVLPSEDEEAAPQVQLSVSNIGLELVQVVRDLVSSPTVTLALVLASNTDRIEGQIGGFGFMDVDINDMSISGDLVMDILINESFPCLTFTPSTAPGLFKA